MKKDKWYGRGSGRKKANPKVQSEEQGGRDLFDPSKIGRATRSAAPSVPRHQSAVSASDVLNLAASGVTSQLALDTTERLMGGLGQRARERNTARAAQDDGGERGRGAREAGRGGGGGARGGGAAAGGGGAARAGTSRAALAAGSQGSQSRAADSSHHNHVDETIEIQSEEDISDEEAEPAWIDGDRGVLVALGGRVIYALPYCTCITIFSAILYEIKHRP